MVSRYYFGCMIDLKTLNTNFKHWNLFRLYFVAVLYPFKCPYSAFHDPLDRCGSAKSCVGNISATDECNGTSIAIWARCPHSPIIDVHSYTFIETTNCWFVSKSTLITCLEISLTTLRINNTWPFVYFLFFNTLILVWISS